MSDKFTRRILGELPTYQLSQFGIVLPDGEVYMSIAAQKHALSSHPKDFPLCQPFLEEVVETPSLVGQSPNHKDAVELIKEIHSDNLNVLVAVKIEQTSSGLYLATTTYPLSLDAIERRVLKGFLIYV